MKNEDVLLVLFLHSNTWNKDGHWDNPKKSKIMSGERGTIKKIAYEKQIHMEEPIHIKMEGSVWITWKKGYKEEQEW